MFLLVGAHCKGFPLSGAPLVSGDQKWEDRLGLLWTMQLRGEGHGFKQFGYLGSYEAAG